MPLNRITLSQQIKTVLDQQAAKVSTTDDPAVSRQEFADGLAEAIDTYLRGATVVGTIPIIPVQVVVPAGTGATVVPSQLVNGRII